MHQLDESFKAAKLKRAKRRRRNLVRRIIGAGVGLVVVGIAGLAYFEQPLWQGWLGMTPSVPVTPQPDEADMAPAVYIPAIVDLAGDPMKISLGDDVSAQVTRFIQRPDEIPPERVASDVAVLSDVMITRSERFMTTLPSSPKDFAFYQSQRTVAPPPPPEPEPAQPDPATAFGPPTEASVGDPAAGVTPTATAEVAAPVEDTSSVATVRSETQRYSPDGEYVGKVLIDRSLESLMTENHFAAADAGVFAQALNTLLQRPGLVAGDIIAIHGVREGAGRTELRPVQMSLYNGGSYVGTLSRSDSGTVVQGADPWVYDNLFNYSGQEEVAQPGRQYRLLDAIYSTAVRNRVPTGVLGEAIMLLSRSFDLNAFATADDRLVLAYAKGGEGDAGGSGRVLYASVEGTDRNMRCYVFKMQTDGDYSCFTETKGGQSVAATPPGMVPPVRGILTTPFGPGMDQVLKKVTNHTGIEWAAPAGTPVVAAYGGTVVSVGEKGDDGIVVQLSHSGGRETFYAHLQSAAKGIAKGSKVKPGDLIGYVGTTGLTAGPVLKFELHLDGNPIDPLATVAPVTSDDDEAVQRLTDRIIHVESGGSSTAKNPLSSAYGLGQFINSTWIRMMNTYRPDLARSMNQTDLLALRADPTIAREMVTNLAREGEAYLRSRGHSITAGRLYLCHFLGMEGAATVLSAQPSLMLVDVLGQGVISANPFLTGHDVAYVIDWAERKMSGKAAPSTPSAPAAPPIPPEFRIYQAAIDHLLAPPDPFGAPGAPGTPGSPAGDPALPAVPPTTADRNGATMERRFVKPGGAAFA